MFYSEDILIIRVYLTKSCLQACCIVCRVTLYRIVLYDTSLLSIKCVLRLREPTCFTFPADVRAFAHNRKLVNHALPSERRGEL